MALNDYYEFRSQIVKALREDLLGPGSVDEVLSDPPAMHYSMGILFPSKAGRVTEDENDESLTDAENDDSPVAFANIKYPSSMGMTFAVDASLASEITLRILGADYERTRRDEGASGGSQGWRRRERAEQSKTISVRQAWCDYLDLEGDLRLFVRVRRQAGSSVAAVTTILINNRVSAGRDLEAKSAACLYQPKLIAESVDGDSVFVERPKTGLNPLDKDLQVYSLIYRDAREFATGHGCSATWVTDSGSSRAVSVETEYIPEYRLALADSNPALDHLRPTMRELATGRREAVCGRLYAMADAYLAWIEERRDELVSPGLEEHLTIGTENVNLCAEACRRIRDGVKTLEVNDAAWEAFVLMNRAMLTQRARSEWIKNGSQGEGPDEDDSHVWRPFQIAFILMSLRGIVEPKGDHRDRDVVDLLWFPTGGGKTEAYLGLIAFTIFHRRLINEDGGGVTAIMRYTLRLLTLQQFERAASLIFSCEALRRQNEASLGTAPISIGLWLGNDSTPGSLSDARQALNQVQAGQTNVPGNPVQLTKCPWCGGSIGPTDYWITEDGRHLKIRCRSRNCEFRTGLPAFVVDEEIYAERPTLIISTADKFANLPWREDVRSLFNLRYGDLSEQLPPELIIQDELHLISGPLGSLAGLYETAIDSLCTRDGVRPKVIASTATIRRADSQVRNLFDREMRQFPPPAISARDSFFAVESDPNEKGDRMYVGLMSPSNSHATVLVRTYASLLQSVSTVEGVQDVRDQYWTLVGYFNSLRILGAARMQVQDDVPSRVQLIAGRQAQEPRLPDQILELTSNIAASEIPAHLQMIAIPFGEPGCVDAIMATNMIAVGVDVDRLGLMAVMGQPQSTSEYIQSTSRVGRRNPGLVVTMYNSAKSRDRSHYESFRAYHAALYRQVEATSVTPFSARARARGLHAVIIAMVRARIAALSPNAGAVAIADHRIELEVIKAEILERVRRVFPENEAETANQIDHIFNVWLRRGETGVLEYFRFRSPDSSLLVEATETQIPMAFPTLRSLRDVDKNSNLFLVNH